MACSSVLFILHVFLLCTTQAFISPPRAPCVVGRGHDALRAQSRYQQVWQKGSVTSVPQVSSRVLQSRRTYIYPCCRSLSRDLLQGQISFEKLTCTISVRCRCNGMAFIVSQLSRFSKMEQLLHDIVLDRRVYHGGHANCCPYNQRIQILHECFTIKLDYQAPPNYIGSLPTLRTVLRLWLQQWYVYMWLMYSRYIIMWYYCCTYFTSLEKLTGTY